ncbi:MAG: aminoacyl-tRNA hydrolase [Erysipelothrix sp.]|nr:aminoacyl-tRNA hydrolase [Erysipelothrix sp.]
MILIVGLGNPGKEYENTRHNTGFKVIDLVAEKLNAGAPQKKFNGLYHKIKSDNTDVILLKPQTFMNLSGECVIQFMNYFKIDLSDLLVIHDDLDLPVGKIRIKNTGSDGGQRGMRNIITHLGTSNIHRCRVGIDNDKRIPTVSYVLGKVESDKTEAYQDSLQRAASCAIDFITKDIQTLMNTYNSNGTKDEVAK